MLLFSIRACTCQYHEDLGQGLYSVTKGKKLGEAVFPIVDQINRGLQRKTPAMCIDIARLNLEAGLKCLEQSANSSANTYLDKALSLLPQSHWESQYSLSLQLYFLLAKAA